MSETPPSSSPAQDRAQEPSHESAQEPALTGRVARGAVWILIAGLFARFLGTINTIIVARLLIPEDIGLVAVATIVMQLLQGFSDIGVSQAVVKFQDADRDDLDTLFTLSFLRGLIIGGLLAIAAPFAAEFYDDQRMMWAFLGIALFPVITGLINPKFYEFERELNFSREFISTVANKLAGVVVSVTIAFIFRSYWAIILGMLTGGIVQLVLSYSLRPSMPRFSFRSMKKVFGFSSWLAGVSFMAALNNKLDVPILARVLGSSGAGVYFMGFQLADMATGQIAWPLTRAIFPGLSSLQRDTERMRTAYLRGVAALGAVAMPAAFGFAFVAQDMVALLLGSKWTAAIPVIQILAPIVALQTLFFATQSYAVAKGMTRLVFFRELIFFIVRLPVFIWASIEYGLQGAIWATAVLGVFHIILNLALYSRISGRFFLEPLLSARRSIGAVAAMAAYFVWLRPLLTGLDDAPLIMRLIADVAIGGVVYIVAHALLWIGEGRPESIERNIQQALAGVQKRLSRN